MYTNSYCISADECCSDETPAMCTPKCGAGKGSPGLFATWRVCLRAHAERAFLPTPPTGYKVCGIQCIKSNAW